MNQLTEQQLTYLAQFGFDPLLLEHWRKGIREGWLSQASNTITEQLHAPSADQIHDMPKQGTPERAELAQIGEDAIRAGQFGVVILNGGMATRFGGVVKGTVEVLDGRSFLDLKIGDVLHAEARCGGRIPVMLMNSFATADKTLEHCREHDDFGLAPGQLSHFTQFVSVRLDEAGEIFETDDGEMSPYGPGHGDFTFALRASGCLDRFRKAGGKYLMLANVDNLGARVAPAVLGHHIRSRRPITVECAPKWPGDAGGSPYVVDSRVQLVEQIRYPEGFNPDIVDVFNTNTFHFDAAAIDRDFDLGWYYVEKSVNGRKAIQIERLVGELTRFLEGNYIRVARTGSRNRFLPIKTPDDLANCREEIAEIYSSAK